MVAPRPIWIDDRSSNFCLSCAPRWRARYCLIRGAGHNLGLVTGWEYRIHDDVAPLWSYVISVYSGDTLEALHEVWRIH